MRRLLVLAIVTLLALSMSGAALAQTEDSHLFAAHLTGDQEVPPVGTSATGRVLYHLSEDHTSLDYLLIATSIDNVTMAHIHLAPVGENGGVVVWLYGPQASPTHVFTFGGLLFVQGTITVEDLVGTLEGSESLDPLLAEMESGGAYTNVHTEQYPSGEIRGQIYTLD